MKRFYGRTLLLIDFKNLALIARSKKAGSAGKFHVFRCSSYQRTNYVLRWRKENLITREIFHYCWDMNWKPGTAQCERRIEMMVIKEELESLSTFVSLPNALEQLFSLFDNFSNNFLFLLEEALGSVQILLFYFRAIYLNSTFLHN